jgi:hypothetical protein
MHALRPLDDFRVPARVPDLRTEQDRRNNDDVSYRDVPDGPVNLPRLTDHRVVGTVGSIEVADSAQRVAGQSINPWLVVFSFQERAAFGHCRHGLCNAEVALLKKLGKYAIFLASIDPGEPSCQVFQMNGREMDCVMISFRDDGAYYMATPELAPHRIADDFATAF